MGYRQNIYASNLRKQKSKVIMVFLPPHSNNESIVNALAVVGKVAEESGNESLKSFKFNF